MIKTRIAAAVSIISLIGIHLPAQADDTIYPESVQNYLIQLAIESDFLRVGDTTKHDHFILDIPSDTLVEMADTACAEFDSGKDHSKVKDRIKARNAVGLPDKVKDKLGEAGADKFADGVVKAAATKHCPKHKSKLLQ